MVFPISLTLEIYGVLLIIILGKVLMEIDFNKSGAYTYFTYKVITYDTNLRTYHNITSSQLLNNNAIIKELAQKYKSTFESILGGLRLGLK